MLSTYLNALTRYAFVPDRIAEPRFDASRQQRLPGAALVPMYLVARYHRQ